MLRLIVKEFDWLSFDRKLIWLYLTRLFFVSTFLDWCKIIRISPRSRLKKSDFSIKSHPEKSYNIFAGGLLLIKNNLFTNLPINILLTYRLMIVYLAKKLYNKHEYHWILINHISGITAAKAGRQGSICWTREWGERPRQSMTVCVEGSVRWRKPAIEETGEGRT